MVQQAPRVPSDLRQVLDGSGLPWRIEHGTRHYKVRLADRLVAILPHSKSHRDYIGRADKNAVARVRRFLRQEHGR
jgi:hypothetical protein